jgi:small subunit ribosomal protein S7
LTVYQVLEGDKEAQSKLPKVMKDAMKKKASGSAPTGSRSYSTSTTSEIGNDGFDVGLVGYTPPSEAPEVPGVKFGLPTLPLPRDGNLKYRYDAVVEQVTNLIMQHGEKSIAQRVR